MSTEPAKAEDDAEGAMQREVIEQRIRTLAYYMWEQEGRQADRADEYYHRAREQLIAEAGAIANGRSGSPTRRSGR